jgi:hypothetical protein
MNLQQFKDWAVAAGSVGKATDGGYIGQCVSLINQYLSKVYDIQAGAWGDAKDWATNGNVAKYFDKVSSPQAGDIGVSGATANNPYGHIWIYTSPTTIIEQNGRVPLRVSTGAAYTPIAILRRKGGMPEGAGVIIQNGDNWFARLSQLQRQVQGSKVPFTRDNFNWWVGKDTLTFIEALSDSKEAQVRENAGNIGEVAVNDRWDQQIYTLQDLLAAANKKLVELEQKPVPVPPSTIDKDTIDQIKETNSIVKQIRDFLTNIFKGK